ncbi:hypothetical protein [Crocinitomix algicola]|uniref:hypothetical protein n=1 Tax=Crocinitomix algicola TaxID=1740263 RepID=UPI000829E357|nr:hypothetical protein [Crocinitomix algicola]
MSGTEAIIYTLLIASVISTIAGLVLRKRGYTFGYYFISTFIAACGILGIIFKIIMDYIN